MSNEDISITNILVDNSLLMDNSDNNSKDNPFQRDILLKKEKSKKGKSNVNDKNDDTNKSEKNSEKIKKHDFNKFLFNTAKLKLNEKLKINKSKNEDNTKGKWKNTYFIIIYLFLKLKIIL